MQLAINKGTDPLTGYYNLLWLLYRVPIMWPLFVHLAFVFFARFLLLAVFLAKPSSQPSSSNF